jgi:hypothetical protein
MADRKNKLHSCFLPDDAMSGFEAQPYEEVSEYLGELSAKTTDLVKMLDKEKLKKAPHDE